MFRRIKDFFRRRQLDKDRRLFEFFDGRRTRREDPMRIHRDLMLHPKFEWDMGFLVDSGDAEATQIVCNAVVEVFQLEHWNDATSSGLTYTELLAVLYGFSEYIDQLKKKFNPGPTSQPPTEPTSSESKASQSEVTNCSSD